MEIVKYELSHNIIHDLDTSNFLEKRPCRFLLGNEFLQGTNNGNKLSFHNELVNFFCKRNKIHKVINIISHSNGLRYILRDITYIDKCSDEYIFYSSLFIVFAVSKKEFTKIKLRT